MLSFMKCWNRFLLQADIQTYRIMAKLHWFEWRFSKSAKSEQISLTRGAFLFIPLLDYEINLLMMYGMALICFMLLNCTF